MGKDDDTDDKVKDAVIPGKDVGDDAIERGQDREQEAPKDVRGALRAAIREQTDKEDDGEDSPKREIKATPSEKKPRAKASGSAKEDTERPDPDDKEDARNAESGDSGRGDGNDKADGVKEEKLEAVGFWKNKGKSTWDKLSKEDQQTILAREQEVSQGFGQISQRLKASEELEKVLAPRIQTIQRNGYTSAQVVDSLFTWMERLGNPNPNIKVSTLKELATNFGIDINQIAPKQTQISDEDGNASYIDPEEPPAWFSEFAQQVQGEVGTLKTTLDGQKQAAANAFVANWAKDKKYYGQVSQLMGKLLVSGAIPLNDDGSLNLDGAYETALKVHPEVSAQVQQDKAAEAKVAARDKAEKDAKDRATKLAAARKAGSGIKPGAPSMPVASTKLNGKNGAPTSVRDSIRAALEDARE